MSLVGCSPWGREESDMTEWLHLHFSLSCIGEGNGNPLQCSCLENPRDRGAWWAAVYGVTQSWTWLKWLINSSSSTIFLSFLFFFLQSSHTALILLYLSHFFALYFLWSTVSILKISLIYDLCIYSWAQWRPGALNMGLMNEWNEQCVWGCVFGSDLSSAEITTFKAIC